MPTLGKTTPWRSEAEGSTRYVRGYTLLPGRATLHRRGGPAGAARLRARHQGRGGLRLVLRAGPQRKGRRDRLGERLRGPTKRRREQQEGHRVGGAEPRRASSAEPGVRRRASRRLRGVAVIMAGSWKATGPPFAFTGGPGFLSRHRSSSCPYLPTS